MKRRELEKLRSVQAYAYTLTPAGFPDGYDDLTLKFKAGDVAAAIGPVASGDTVIITANRAYARHTTTYNLTVDDGTTSCVQSRHVQWVDAEGIAERVEIARRAGWGGVSLWALGYDDDEAWTSLDTASRAPLSAEPSDTSDG